MRIRFPKSFFRDIIQVLFLSKVEAISMYNNMKENLMEYLAKFAQNRKVVREEDIREFFEVRRWIKYKVFFFRSGTPPPPSPTKRHISAQFCPGMSQSMDTVPYLVYWYLEYMLTLYSIDNRSMIEEYEIMQ